MDERLRQQQFSLARHLRDPLGNAPPPGLEERRLRVYRELFYNAIEGVLASGFPRLRGLLGDPDWHGRVREFYREERSHTPLFTRIAGVFVDYLQANVGADQAWQAELAHFEWSETRLYLAEPDDPPHRPDGELLDEVPLLSSLALPLGYRWAVHDLDADPAEPAAAPTLLLMRRDSSHRVHTARLTPLAYRLLVSLASRRLSGREHLAALALEAGARPEPSTRRGWRCWKRCGPRVSCSEPWIAIRRANDDAALAQGVCPPAVIRRGGSGASADSAVGAIRPTRCAGWSWLAVPTKKNPGGDRLPGFFVAGRFLAGQAQAPPEPMVEAQLPRSRQQQRQQCRQVDRRELEIAEAVVGDRVTAGQFRQARPLGRPVYGGVATRVTTISTRALRRVPRPSRSNSAPSSSAHIDSSQLRTAGRRSKGNGKADWMSPNQFSPFHFSQPDSKNSQARNNRRDRSAHQPPQRSSRTKGRRQARRSDACMIDVS